MPSPTVEEGCKIKGVLAGELVAPYLAEETTGTKAGKKIGERGKRSRISLVLKGLGESPCVKRSDQGTPSAPRVTTQPGCREKLGSQSYPLHSRGTVKIFQLWLIQEAAQAPVLLWSPVVFNFSQGSFQGLCLNGPWEKLNTSLQESVDCAVLIWDKGDTTNRIGSLYPKCTLLKF